MFAVADFVRGQNEVRHVENEPRKRDVFLGGACGSSTWRENIAIPIFRSVLLTVLKS